jgi:hypothetical protein
MIHPIPSRFLCVALRDVKPGNVLERHLGTLAFVLPVMAIAVGVFFGLWGSP